MSKWINWKNPQTFTEKLQWLKLYNRKPKYTTMVDKLAVKDFVSERIGPEYIIPTIGVWDSVNEIDIDSLPSSFVLKTTHGGGSGGVVVCKDKSKFDLESAKRKLNESLKSDIYINYREWPYKNVPRRIIAEKFIEIPGKKDLTDYKVFCFNGEPRYIQVIQDRNTNETIDFFDTEWNHQEFIGLNPKVKNATKIPDCPHNFNEMLSIARKLSEGIPFVRVDLYQTQEECLFGEMTFYPASGFGRFTPDSWNLMIGNLIKLPKV